MHEIGKDTIETANGLIKVLLTSRVKDNISRSVVEGQAVLFDGLKDGSINISVMA